MEARYATPKDLVEALHRRGAGAREQLCQWLREPVRHLTEEIVRQHQMPQDPDQLTSRALHSAEMFLRTRKPAEFEGMSRRAFEGTVLFFFAKVLSRPSGGESGQGPEPEPLPDCPAYQGQALFLPYERVGGQCFGGDWFGGSTAADGALWVMVADVTGHGYYAYLLASNLPSLWRMCWDELPPAGGNPTDLLGAMHGALEACLPEGTFVEATLARLRPGGEATVAPAGGSRLLLRGKGQGRINLCTVRGTWLGLCAPEPQDQQTWSLDVGDELVMASDGLFDQVQAWRPAADFVANLDACGDGSVCLFDVVRQVLHQAVQACAQVDDITVVALQRRERTDGPPATPTSGAGYAQGKGRGLDPDRAEE
jgi:hypothetical protein